MPYKKLAIACQGGGSHCAFTAGVLASLLKKVAREEQPSGEALLVLDGPTEKYEIVALSGTSGGAISAYLAWLDLLRIRQELAPLDCVQTFWASMEAHWPGLPPFEMPPHDLLSNLAVVGWSQLEGFLPQLAPTPNPASHAVQQDLKAKIVRAAGSLAFLSESKRVKPGGLPAPHLANLAYSNDHFPVLLIGAANIDEGEFAPFLSTPTSPPEIDQILASTALPDIFPAVRLTMPESHPVPGTPPVWRTYHYWDGLFSQNPPIGDLLGFEALEARPDEIWIIRINPAKRRTEQQTLYEQAPRTPGEIYDRRNELAGNLSLEQEKSFIRKINSLIRKGHLPSPQGSSRLPARDLYKEVGMWGIAMEGCADLPDSEARPHGDWRTVTLKLPRQYREPLSRSSKLLRSPDFLRELQAVGEEALRDFYFYRSEILHPSRTSQSTMDEAPGPSSAVLPPLRRRSSTQAAKAAANR